LQLVLEDRIDYEAVAAFINIHKRQSRSQTLIDMTRSYVKWVVNKNMSFIML